ncbi:hypothetical protein CR513_26888, partial [Mucuna pruriens]
MKGFETIKGYSNKLLDIAIRLLCAQFDIRNIYNLFGEHQGCVKYHFSISHTCIVSLRTMKVYERRRNSGRCFISKILEKWWQKQEKKNNKLEVLKMKTKAINLKLFHYVLVAKKKKNHPPKRYWWRLDTRYYKYYQLRHIEKICKSYQQQGEAKVAEDQQEEEEICHLYKSYDQELFKQLNKTTISKLQLKLIYDVLYVPGINQNLLSVAQLLEKGYKMVFEDKKSVNKDTKDVEVIKI